MEPQTIEEPAAEAVAESQPEAQPQGQEPQAAPVAFDPEKLPAEIKSYVSKREEEISKRYHDYDDRKKQADEWASVKNDPRFQTWVRTLNEPTKPQGFEISDEQFTAALSDKQAFARLVQDAAKNLLETQIGPQLQHTQNQVQFQQRVSELSEVTKAHPDFKDLDKRGLIEPVIRKYGNISFEDAYWIAKQHTFNEDVDRKARGVVDLKKKSSVEKPGTPPGARTSRVKAKNREEAMTMVMEAVRAGRPVPEFEDIGDE